MSVLTATADVSVTGLALSAAVTTAVGLAVGLVAFPIRWWLQSAARRRQENVAAYRDALRVLRAAQREARYGERSAGDRRSRDAIPAKAWDEALHRLAEARDTETYGRFERLADLSLRAGALATLFPPEANEDPRTA